jgi:hypothetical protein
VELCGFVYVCVCLGGGGARGGGPSTKALLMDSLSSEKHGSRKEAEASGLNKRASSLNIPGQQHKPAQCVLVSFGMREL